ncbi:hypothetical protein [Alienimonas californiensis]|uniref:Tetratricopeptide repeat protein n=1 Tax=Alienimonas californiensis TaxID=2527989 RepID=A0A517PFM8_9PLAN|nr:hypothetical protein [Alienimonas californiensis]QDT18154.1 hypothetical protein CA12_42950 [Alienimonas californiensis]
MSDGLPPEVAIPLELATSAPHGPAAVALWETVVQAADAAGLPVGLRMDFRLELVREAAMHAKLYDRALGPFAVVLAEADRDPEARWIFWPGLLWKYKWLSDALASFVAFPRERVLSVLDDFAARCVAHGFSLRPAENYRANALWLLGEEDAARDAFARFEAAPRDPLSDCQACEASQSVTHAVRLGDDAGAVERAAPLLGGRLSCAEEPERTHSKVLAPLLRLGRETEAAEQHRLGLAALRRFPAFTFCASRHFLYLARRGETEEVGGLLQRTAGPVGATSDDNRREYLAAAGVALNALADHSDRPRRFRLPSDFPVPNPDGVVPPSELAVAFRQAADELAARFDARNGNDAVSRRQQAERAFVRPS